MYFTINDFFQQQKNRPYLGSRDIDIGFVLKPMMTKHELESTPLFKTINILELKGFQPEGFRYRKDISDFHTGNTDPFTFYIDILVNAYPPSLYDIYPQSFFEVPFLEYVYSNPQFQITIPAVSHNVVMPIRELLIAMKMHSLPARGHVRHKMVKDLCDLYGLLWYSSISIEDLIKGLQTFVKRETIEQLKKTIDSGLIKESEALLGEPKGSIHTVLHALNDRLI